MTRTVERLKTVLAEFGIIEPITLMRIGDHGTAQALRFLGSPSVRINGIDIDPTAQSSREFGLMCRRYPGSDGVPPEEMIRKAVVGHRPGE